MIVGGSEAADPLRRLACGRRCDEKSVPAARWLVDARTELAEPKHQSGKRLPGRDSTKTREFVAIDRIAVKRIEYWRFLKTAKSSSFCELPVPKVSPKRERAISSRCHPSRNTTP